MSTTIDVADTLRRIETAISKMRSSEDVDAGVHVLQPMIARWEVATYPDPTGRAQIADALDVIEQHLEGKAAAASDQRAISNALDRTRQLARDEAHRLRR